MATNNPVGERKQYPQPEREPLEKEWGTDEVVFENDSVRVHRIVIKQGGQSTQGNFHKHRQKFNKFYVESGILDIYIKSDKQDYYTQIGDSCEFRSITVFPNNLHRFVAITDCVAYEIYWVNCNAYDILRFDSEGKVIFKQR